MAEEIRERKRRIELLSPARDVACGIAAIDHGADAVYIGALRFGARAAAGNSVEDIGALCRYAHKFGARVYVTVNTIVYDAELPLVRQLLRGIASAGADAVLFQDMAVPLIVGEEGLRLELHASTQTDNRTAEKVLWLRGLGVRRVVLARELTVEEIAEIARRVPDVELEVFVHGALCAGFSGLCYASQHCLGRSANRGECAQVCRMRFDLEDGAGRKLVRGRHLLSLKDLNLSEHLGELIAAGATSLKIEGRLKDIGYVKNVTAAYSQLIDRFIAQHPEGYERASEGRCRYAFTPDLGKTFNRGYTTYFLHGRQRGIFSPETPKAMGEFVGMVKTISGERVITVAGTSAFANGDGLCFIDPSRELQGFRVNRAVGNRLTVAGRLPPTLRRGARLYRNYDQALERLLAGKSAERKIPVTMSLEATDGGFRLTMIKGEKVAGDGAVTGLAPSARIECELQKAEKPQRENIVRELSKLGNTPYECVDVILPDGFDYFIPASRLSELRRKVLEEMEGRVNRRYECMEGASTFAVADDCDERRLGGERNAGKRCPLWQTGTVPAPGQPYMLNVANALSGEFYREHGVDVVPAFELQEPDGEKVLMQCRHCLRYALGHCIRRGGTPPEWEEPLFLRLDNGKKFRLRFDCKNCQMELI